MPASTPQDIRNIVLLGHGGSGKTTIAEALLHDAKITSRLGSVDDGTSHLDFSDIEKERGHSVDPAVCFFDHAGKTVNLVDAPGYPDFIGGAISALAGADIGVVVIAATSGIEVNTRRLFKVAQDNKLALAIVINKIDGENVNLERLLGEIREVFGPACKPMNLPAGGNKSVVDCFKNTEGATDIEDVGETHTQLVESIIEADETLMESYLGGEAVAPEKLSAAFAKAMVAGTVVPVLFTAAKADVGIKEFADAIVSYFPDPSQMPVRPVRSDTKPDAAEIAAVCDPSKSFIAQAFRITTDPFVGKLAWVRILQGTATPETQYLLRDEKKSVKIGHVFKIQGKETREVKSAIAGDIIALAKVEDIHSGDVLHVEATPMYRARPAFPNPMYSLAITPKSRGDEQKISEALHKLAEEDPTFVPTRDIQTARNRHQRHRRPAPPHHARPR